MRSDVIVSIREIPPDAVRATSIRYQHTHQIHPWHLHLSLSQRIRELEEEIQAFPD